MLGHPLRVLAPLVVTLLALGLLGTAAPAGAASADDPQLVLTAPGTARIGRTMTVQAAFQDDDQRVTSGLGVSLQRQGDGGAWTTIADGVTASDGTAGLSVVPVAGPQQLRARISVGDLQVTSVPVSLEGIMVSSDVHLHGSDSVVDEQSGHLSVLWLGSDGYAVKGRVAVYFHKSGQPWTRLGSVITSAGGRAYLTISPRWDTSYQLRAESGPGWRSDTSPTWKVDNRPPLRPVTLPSGASRPHTLLAQYRASGDGPNIAVHLISDTVWKRMFGRSWHPGCPIGRGSLRYVTVNYWGFDGYRHRGELVVRDAAVSKFKVALTKLYDAQVPIRSMYLPDRFGRNPSSPGANDLQSMKHDNTSAFNCRGVTGDPGTMSPHSYGRSIDINPWENPFHSHVGWLPTKWWAHKQAGKYAWKYRSSLVVKLMTSAGFRWTYATTDSQHFDG
ncbi:M15 family metallopeptidase [Nocardioides marmorisolisilvae]|uniref:M15 family peptidase n=1 Tax=Nocardioides marmorisolisilvae TaxID=1542737 RepID=A0A3N0DSG1_9ACTN|nr:M15 family metallopeptidase [Nocardioides marmorisolisilvae]RNL78426.1 M15 family peptidase [Nocardioides marmorisolisilvae]